VAKAKASSNVDRGSPEWPIAEALAQIAPPVWNKYVSARDAARDIPPAMLVLHTDGRVVRRQRF